MLSDVFFKFYSSCRKGLFQDDNNVFILMEYLQGGELFSHLRKAEKFNEELAKFYVSEIASALSVMNSLCIVYRDLKPENIMIGMKLF